MTTYNTGNPVGSTDVRDLYDNAQNFDKFSLGQELEYPDRLGVPRKSLAGIRADVTEALSRLGYQVLGDYAAGLVVQNYRQVFRKDGEFYRADASLNLPYTLAGDWLAESAKFVSVGDAVLRQELANGKSALVDSAVVGWRGRTVADRLNDTANVKDYGAIADGTHHPLSERYSTLTEAQAVYPHATALSQSIDWAAAQAAFNSGAPPRPFPRYWLLDQ